MEILIGVYLVVSIFFAIVGMTDGFCIVARGDKLKLTVGTLFFPVFWVALIVGIFIGFLAKFLSIRIL